MKKFNNLILIIFCTAIFCFNSGYSQVPTYYLEAKNFTVSGTTDNILEWDIYIQHSNPPAYFEYAGGQYFIAFDPNIANGGTLTYSIVNSDLPPNMQPRSPSIGTAANPSQTVLRLAINSPPGAGFGYNMTNNGYPGTKIVRMRLQTSAAELNCEAMLHMTWRNPPIVTFATKIFAYVGAVITEITTPNTHNLDSSASTIHGWCGPGQDFHVYFDIEAMLNPITNKFFRSDTVEVQLRSDVSPYNIVKIKKVFTDSGFASVRMDLLVYNYIVIKYRNAIETWSASPRFFIPPYYYFTDSAGSAYGNNQVLVGTRYCIYSGDTNKDGVIDGTDLSMIDNDAHNLITGTYLVTDLNGDNIVDGSDMAACDNNVFNQIVMMSPDSVSP